MATTRCSMRYAPRRDVGTGPVTIGDAAQWIEHHRALGVEHFYLYDYSAYGRQWNTDPVLHYLVAADIVTLVPWWTVLDAGLRDPRNTLQDLALNHCLNKYGSVHTWLGFFDVDEFWIPMDGGADGLRNFLRDLSAESSPVGEFWGRWHDMVVCPGDRSLTALERCRQRAPPDPALDPLVALMSGKGWCRPSIARSVNVHHCLEPHGAAVNASHGIRRQLADARAVRLYHFRAIERDVSVGRYLSLVPDDAPASLFARPLRDRIAALYAAANGTLPTYAPYADS